jgi:hypothetical protein
MPSDEPAEGTAARLAGGAAGGMSVRGQLVLAVVAVTAGAVLVLLAASRQWVVEVAVRPAPLSPVRTGHTGTDLVPWVPALALVALAGAGALVATRSAGRALVSVFLVVAGAGTALGAGYGLLAARHQSASASPAWPLVALAGGLVVAAAGWYALRRCRSWPTMGTRYEPPTTGARPVNEPPGTVPSDPTPSDPTLSAADPAAADLTGGGSGAGRPAGVRPLIGRRAAAPDDDPARLWDALDRGDDPTDR